jgi:hypothetical protein
LIARLRPYVVLPRAGARGFGVIDCGADYEYRYVGEAERQAFKTYFKGIRLTQIEAHAPEFGRILRSAYDQVRSAGIDRTKRMAGPPGVARGD